MSPLPIPRRGAGWSTPARFRPRGTDHSTRLRQSGASCCGLLGWLHAPAWPQPLLGLVAPATPDRQHGHMLQDRAQHPPLLLHTPPLPLRPDLLLRRGGRVLGRPGAHLLLQRRRELLAGKGGDDRLVHERLDRPSGDPGPVAPLTPVRLLRGPARATRHAPTAALVPTAQQPA